MQLAGLRRPEKGMLEVPFAAHFKGRLREA